MKIRKKDGLNKFVAVFDTETGFYMRSGVIKDGKNTNVDPFMTQYPELIDVGIMGHCIHGSRGLCVKGGVQCYQNGLNKRLPNMSVEFFRSIVKQSQKKTFQIALGGRGDPNKHENFGEICQLCRNNMITPNYTTSGFGLTEEEVSLTKELCGAVAVSWYRQCHTEDAIRRFVDAGCTVNVHYVLGSNTIGEAIERLRHGTFPDGINAVIFLMHKPVGLGTEVNMLHNDDPRVREFFDLVNVSDTLPGKFQIGFDSCSVPAIINNTSNVMGESLDTCEGARWSMYISSEGIGLPCSFDQDYRWGVNLNKYSIKEAWDSQQFEDFRQVMRNSCPKCEKRVTCMGGCPIKKQIVLCDLPERKQYEVPLGVCD